LVIGPYVARASGSSASICLQPQVDGERILGIHYRTALTDGCVSGHVPMSQSEYQYAKHLVCAELRDLRPQTSYIYAIEDSSHRLHKGGSFSTFADRAHPSSSAPGSMSKEPFKVRLAAIADCGEGGKGARLVRNALFNHSSHDHEDQPHMQVSASALLVAGDIAYEHGTLKDYTKKFFGVWAPVLRHVPLITVLGNHDAKPGLGHSSCISGAGPYFDLFAKGGSPTLEHGGDKAHDSVPGARPMDIPPAALAAIRRQEGLLYYSVDVHPQVHILAIDSNVGIRQEHFYYWLLRDLRVAKQRSQWVIAILHHPPYTDGNYHSDSYTRLGDIRRMLLPWLEWANVDLVVSGHSHGYERSMLVAGHYGSSDTLRDHMIKSKGDQHHNGSSSFYKKEVAFGGALYIVAGSGSKVDLRHGKHVGQLRHPVHMTGLSTLGGLRIDLSAGTMHIRFLGIDQKGANAVLDEVFVHKDSSVGNNAPPASDAAMAMLRVHSPDGPPLSVDSYFQDFNARKRPEVYLRS